MHPNAVISCLILLFHNVCCYQDDWQELSAWSELQTKQPSPSVDNNCQCPIQTPADKSLATIEDQLALIYFKKFVNSLFSRERLKFGRTTKLFKRSLEFTLLQSQVEEIENIEDMRDLDILLTKIMDKAKDIQLSDFDSDDYAYTHQGMGVFALIKDIFKDIALLLKKSEIKFMLTVLLVVATGLIVKRRFRISAIAIVLGGFFLYGYFITYLECNRKLEVDAMIQVIDSNHEPTSSAVKDLFSRVFNYFKDNSPEAKQKERLLKSSKLNLPFCRPDHVFVTYTSDIILKQMELIIEKATKSIASLNSELSFPLNYIAPFALILLIAYLLKLFFKYVISPKAWIGLVRGRSSAPTANLHQPALGNEPLGDRLSGENLKILINAIGTTSLAQPQQQQQKQLPLPVSGVQELLEPIEAPPTQAPHTSKPTNEAETDIASSRNSNVSNSSADIAQEAGFTVVNDSKDIDNIENC